MDASLLIAPPPAPDAAHFKDVVEAILEGQVVPFLGAGINRCGNEEVAWDPKQPCRLPLGGELAAYLAKEFEYPLRTFKAACTCHGPDNTHEFNETPEDLLRVSQFAEFKKDRGALNRRLAWLFDHDYPLTPLHELLAGLPKKLLAGECEHPHLLVVTTNYDDIMERAFAAAGEPFDVVYYMVGGPDRGRFIHKGPDGETSIITEPNRNPLLTLRKRSIVFKIHGAVHRNVRDEESRKHSFMITEDDYIDYLARVDLPSIPVALRAKLLQSNFLFLGYSLRDWNLRAFLHRIWSERTEDLRAWAILRRPDALEAKFWDKRDVRIFDADLNDYTAELACHL